MLFFLYMLTGAFAGTCAGLVGIGGGLIVVPILATIFDHIGFPSHLIMHFAAGTSLAVMIVTSSSSVRTHIKLGSDIWPIFKLLMPGILLGTITGAVLADILHSDTLKIIFGLVLIVAAMRSFFGKTKSVEPNLPALWVTYLVGFCIGTLSGLLGIGGGLLLAPFLFHFNVNVRLAIATSAACGLLVSTTGTVSYLLTGLNEVHSIDWATGHIYWPAFLGIALMTPIFARVGAKLSYKLPVDKLRKLFAIFMFIAAAKMLYPFAVSGLSF